MSVWLFPGQGAQKPGMGADLLGVSQVAETFEIASEELGIDLAALANEGSVDEVNQAYHAQSLTMAVTVGLGKTLIDAGVAPDAMVGFSLGQISALALSGMLTERQAFSLLRVRATAMARACEEQPGGMLALIAASHEEAQALCDQCAQGDILIPANYNCPGQVVISGDRGAVDRAQEAWQREKRKCSRLNTAGGFHSSLMEDASIAVAKACGQLSFQSPSVPVLCNTDAQSITAVDAPDRLALQVKSPVLFQQSIESLIQQGHHSFVEVGFGGVLCGLVKRIDRGSDRVKIGTMEELRAFMASKEDSSR